MKNRNGSFMNSKPFCFIFVPFVIFVVNEFKVIFEFLILKLEFLPHLIASLQYGGFSFTI